LALDLRWVYGDRFRLSISVSPQGAWGTPRSGSLAEEASARLLYLPALAVMQYRFPTGGMRPYGGLGAGVLFAGERLSFTGPLGAEEASVSATRFAWSLMAGLEQKGTRGAFAEVWYVHAGTASIEGQSDSGVSLATLQFRLGWRTRLK
jgi:opacity protein-like surface antigen